MIYITGDVHSKIKGNWEQKGQVSEVKISKEYLRILKKYKLKSTLFINGKCLETEVKDVKELLNYDVELGGHTYDSFGNMNIFKSYINRKFFGCVYGSLRYQKKDIKKTKKAFEKFGLKMNSWRTHAFGSNEGTFKLLAKEKVKYVSDLLGDIRPYKDKNSLIHLPINIPVDQNTISYGILRPENRDPFASCTKGRIKAEEWFEILKKRVKENERKKIPSIILIHPITMAVLDKFRLFERVCKFLSKYKCEKISEFCI